MTKQERNMAKAVQWVFKHRSERLSLFDWCDLAAWRHHVGPQDVKAAVVKILQEKSALEAKNRLSA